MATLNSRISFRLENESSPSLLSFQGSNTAASRLEFREPLPSSFQNLKDTHIHTDGIQVTVNQEMMPVSVGRVQDPIQKQG
jgi:hypothetical protein